VTATLILIAFEPPQAIFLSDRSRTVLLDVGDHREQIGLDVEAASGDTSKVDLIWVPGEGIVTGGRKFARHYFLAPATTVDSCSRGSRFPSCREARHAVPDRRHFHPGVMEVLTVGGTVAAPNRRLGGSRAVRFAGAFWTACRTQDSPRTVRPRSVKTLSYARPSSE
jgi:hypothetical protein